MSSFVFLEFFSQGAVLDLEAPTKSCEIAHWQCHDLLCLFKSGSFPHESNYNFLGGYVDRSKQSLYTITLMSAYEVKHAENFFQSRGNHERASTTRFRDCYDECSRRYDIKMWKQVCDVFNCMSMTMIMCLFKYAASRLESNYVFLGFYEEPGKQTLNTITLMFADKVKYPEKLSFPFSQFLEIVWNHERAAINQINGYYDECKRRYNKVVICLKDYPVISYAGLVSLDCGTSMQEFMAKS